MKIITYKQYVEYSKINNILQLKEPEKNYEIERETKTQETEIIYQIDKMHDKMFRNILGIKKEMVEFLNKFLNLKETIKLEKIVQCKTDFITKNYKNKQCDVIYKIKEQPIYFLVEHQSTIDKNIIIRMWEYIGEIMRRESILQQTYLEDENTYPIVVPVVIYTGKKKWNIKTNLSDEQYKSIQYKQYQINFGYNLIDINQYKFDDLLQKKSLLGSIMIIEKCLTKEELEEKMYEIIRNVEDEKDREVLLEIVINIIQPILGTEKTENIIKKLEKKEENNMSPIVECFVNSIIEEKMQAREEGIAEGKKEGRAEGKRQSIFNIAKKMIKRKMKIEEITEITGLSKEEIEKLALDKKD